MNKYWKISYLLIPFFIASFIIEAFAGKVIYTDKSQDFGPSMNFEKTLTTDELFDIVTSKPVNQTVATGSLANSNLILNHDGKYYTIGEYMGNFSLSGYCACKKCGSGTGFTASGHPVRENHTIAADWNILPKGTMIVLVNAYGKDGTNYSGIYEVEDKGGGIKDKRLDIYRPTHDKASLVTYFGKCYGDVYIANPIIKEEN